MMQTDSRSVGTRFGMTVDGQDRETRIERWAHRKKFAIACQSSFRVEKVPWSLAFTIADEELGPVPDRQPDSHR